MNTRQGTWHRDTYQTNNCNVKTNLCYIWLFPYERVSTMAESGILSCTNTDVRMSDSATPKFATPQAKTWLDVTAQFGSIALVVLLFAIPPALFLVFRGSDQNTWRDVFSTLSQVLDSCCVNQSVRNTVSSSWQTVCCASTCLVFLETGLYNYSSDPIYTPIPWGGGLFLTIYNSIYSMWQNQWKHT